MDIKALSYQKRTAEWVFTDPSTIDVCLGTVPPSAITEKLSTLVTAQEGTQETSSSSKHPSVARVPPEQLQLPPSASQQQGCTLRNVLTCPEEVIDDADDLLIGKRDTGILPYTLLLAVLNQRVCDVPDVLLGKSRWVRDIMDT